MNSARKEKKWSEERLPSRRNLMRTIHFEYSVRFHMFLIVSASVAVAVLVTRVLLGMGVETLWVRWLPALLAAYAAFFIGIYAWLRLSRYGRHLRKERDGSSLDGGGIAIPVPSFEGIGTPVRLPVGGGGGTFDGGGASASWVDASLPLESPPLEVAGVKNLSLDVVDLGGDEGGCLLVIGAAILFVFLCVLLGGAAYVVYQAPAILAEVVFEVLLASSLLRGTRGAGAHDWGVVLLRRTWIPFVLIAAAAMAFAVFARYAAPEAKTAAQVFHTLSAQR